MAQRASEKRDALVAVADADQRAPKRVATGSSSNADCGTSSADLSQLINSVDMVDFSGEKVKRHADVQITSAEGTIYRAHRAIIGFSGAQVLQTTVLEQNTVLDQVAHIEMKSHTGMTVNMLLNALYRTDNLHEWLEWTAPRDAPLSEKKGDPLSRESIIALGKMAREYGARKVETACAATLIKHGCGINLMLDTYTFLRTTGVTPAAIGASWCQHKFIVIGEGKGKPAPEIIDYEFWHVVLSAFAALCVQMRAAHQDTIKIFYNGYLDLLKHMPVQRNQVAVSLETLRNEAIAVFAFITAHCISASRSLQRERSDAKLEIDRQKRLVVGEAARVAMCDKDLGPLFAGCYVINLANADTYGTMLLPSTAQNIDINGYNWRGAIAFYRNNDIHLQTENTWLTDIEIEVRRMFDGVNSGTLAAAVIPAAAPGFSAGAAFGGDGLTDASAQNAAARVAADRRQ
jgi:hypothetical protein